jgi:ribosomal protein S27E
MDTKQVIASMLTENTGRHFLDSGGEMGRHWQRNAIRQFSDEKAASVSYSYGYIEFGHNLYHWLVDRLEYDAEADAEFQEWASAPEREDSGWYQLLEEYLELVSKSRGATGFYGEGNPVSVNTYNGESLLSQVIQFGYFETEDGAYVLLQIHGGADVRGGYTKPRMFQCTHELSIFEQANGHISCSDCDEGWYTDDGCHWYGNNGGANLELYDVTKADDDESWTEGSMHVDDEGRMHCPDCGGKLVAS